MTHEKRSYLCQYLDIFDQDSNEQLGYMADLSTKGLMFISEQTLPLNEIRDIYIENNLIPAGEEPVFIKARIKTIWHKLNINPKMHCTGCKILAIEPHDHERLEKLVKSLSFDPALEVHRTSASY